MRGFLLEFNSLVLCHGTLAGAVKSTKLSRERVDYACGATLAHEVFQAHDKAFFVADAADA